MEDKNGVDHPIIAATVSALCEDKNSWKNVEEFFTAEVRWLKDENTRLQSKIDTYQSNEIESACLIKELHELKKDLNASEESLKSCQKDLEYHMEKVKQLTKKKDLQGEELSLYKQEVFALRRQKNRDVDMARSQWHKQEQELMEKIHILELEVEKLQKVNTNLESKIFLTKNLIVELAQRDKTIAKEKKRHSDLEFQLEQAMKELDACPPPKVITLPFYLPSDVDRVYKQNQDLKERLITKTQQLTTKRRQLERKAQIIDEKEKQCEELKHQMSRLPAPESLDLIPKCQWIIREQCEKIKSLRGQVNMLQQTEDGYKREYKKLAEREATSRKLYLSERMRNMNLREALQKSGVKLLPEHKSGTKQTPPISKQREPHIKTPKSSSVRLPPTSQKLESEVKIPYTVLPPISAQRHAKVFMTETSRD